MSDLRRAAFGDDPGHWPLPPARGAEQLWWRAVAAGGQGRYALAWADLDALDRVAPRGPSGRAWLARAAVARASFLRQLGRHVEAQRWDARAWALCVDPDPKGVGAGDPIADSMSEAAADALVGLAADALGVGRYPLARRLLTRADGAIAAAGGRVAVRAAWVGAELAMVTGAGERAVAAARDAVAGGAPLGSRRHAVKSEVVLAAALCCAGGRDEAAEVAEAAARRADAAGLLPLRWAVTCLLIDLTGEAARLGASRDAVAAEIARRGGNWGGRLAAGARHGSLVSS